MITLRIALASLQHDIWSHWMRYQLSVCQLNPDGSATIPTEKVDRWQRQIATPYHRLSVREQVSDLEQADKVLDVLRTTMPLAAFAAILAWRGKLRVRWAVAWLVYGVLVGAKRVMGA